MAADQGVTSEGYGEHVYFHLAENKGDQEYPFAFVATCAEVDDDGDKPARHRPLHAALEEYAATDRERATALLAPIQAASQSCPFLAELIETGDIFHPMPWSPQEAYQFLCEAERVEESGVRVRIPDWWRGRQPSRPKVSVSLGGKTPARLGMGAVLDFDISVSLGGDPLTEDEVAALLAAEDSLVQLRGRWVEVNSERLRTVLDQWQQVAEDAAAGRVSLARGMRLLAGVEGPEAEVGASDAPRWSEVMAGSWLQERLTELRSPSVSAEIATPDLKATLRPYQQQGVQWLWTLRHLGVGGCLADDMGLGKTMQVLGLLALFKRHGTPGTDLLVAPASLLSNWDQEIRAFCPQLTVKIAHPSASPTKELQTWQAEDLRDVDLVITTYQTATRLGWIETTAWRHVILDEAQAIKNPAAKQTQAIKRLKAQWRVALTGTPVENSLGDLWSLFDFLNKGLLGSAKAFNDVCKQLAERDNPDYAPLRRLVQPYILRRLKTDKHVIADLPEKTEVKRFCLLSRTQAKLYQRAVDDLARALEDDDGEGMRRRGAILAALTRFKQICNHPSQWLNDHTFAPADSGKFASLAAVGEAIAAAGEKVLVFTQFRGLTEPLARYLQSIFGRAGSILHGGTPVKQRQQRVNQFQNDASVPFMVLSLKAAGTGLNLTAASHVVHFDRWWNPAVENQATDRAFRLGQRRNVMVHKFVTRGTVEERIDELMTRKQALASEVLSGGGDALLTEMDDEEIMQMVRLDLASASDG